MFYSQTFILEFQFLLLTKFIRISIFIITKVTEVNKPSFLIISNLLNNQQSLIMFCSVTDFSQPSFPPLELTRFLPDVSLPDDIPWDGAASMVRPLFLRFER